MKDYKKIIEKFLIKNKVKSPKTHKLIKDIFAEIDKERKLDHYEDALIQDTLWRLRNEITNLIDDGFLDFKEHQYDKDDELNDMNRFKLVYAIKHGMTFHDEDIIKKPKKQWLGTFYTWDQPVSLKKRKQEWI